MALFAARTDSVSGQVDILHSEDGVEFTLPAELDDVFIANAESFNVGPGEQVYWGDNQDILKPGAVYTWSGSAAVELEGTPTDCSSANNLVYDRTNQRLYVGFIHNTTPNVGYWDSATQTWTLLADSAALTAVGETYSGKLALTLDPGTGATIDLFTWRSGGDGSVLRWNGTGWDVDIALSLVGVFGFIVDSEHQLAKMLAVDDELYLFFRNLAAGGTPSKTVFKRDSAGTWTDISPADVTLEYGTFRTGAVHEGDLYAFFYTPSFSVMQIWKRSGTTWSMDFDSLIDNPTSTFGWFQSMLSFNDELYAAPEYNAGTEDYILVKTGGTWAHRALEDSAFNFAVADLHPTSTTFGVEAGESQVATGPLPSIVSLAAVLSGNIDGELTYEWTQESGPDSSPVIESSDALLTDITFSAYIPGDYKFRITVTITHEETGVAFTVYDDVFISIQLTRSPTVTSGIVRLGIYD